MTEQLSTIIGHVQELSALDLAGVEPTAHALDLTNQVRARRRAAVVAARRGAAKRPRPGRRRLPRAADGMTETLGPDRGALRRAARRARALVPRARRPPTSTASTPADDGRPRLPAHAPRGRPRARPTASTATAAAASQGVPIALKDILCTRGEETTAGSRILEGYVPIYDGGCVTRVKAAGLDLARQDQHGRVRDGLVDRELARSASPTTRGTPTASPAARRGGSAAAVAAGLRAARARHRHRRLDPPAGGALRRRRA